MESEFEIADRKELATIAKVCLEKGLKFNEPFRDSNYNIVKSVSKLFGYSNIDTYDVEFICAFIIDNYHIIQSWIDGNLSYSNISNENSNFTGLNYPPSTTNMQQQLNLYENNNKLNLIVNSNTNGGKKPKKSRKDTSNSFVYFLFLLDISK